MRKRTIFALLAVGAVTALVAQEAGAKYEEPAYTILRSSGNIEIRRYPELLVAEVVVDGTGDSAANQAFKILAGYIFGKNISHSKIAMTVPVTEEMSAEKIAMTVPVTTSNESNKMTMRFFLPSNTLFNRCPRRWTNELNFKSCQRLLMR